MLLNQSIFNGSFWKSLNNVRAYIFLGMVIVVACPLILLMQNSYQIAYQRELNKVEQSHLVIAENLASSLDRYATDMTAAFDFVAENEGRAFALGSLSQLLEAYSFRMVAVVDSDNSNVEKLYERDFSVPSPELLDSLREMATNETSTLSGVQVSPHGPVIYVARMSPTGALVFGAVDTSYFVEQQIKIAFGDRGHAMIVDHKGRVIAHPKKEWTETSKDVSGLEVVQRMTSGRTGVLQFYAPPIKADVIAGYTFVPSTGWGAMVPQPIAELETAASLEANSYIQILLLLFILALLASWLISGLIARPIQSLSHVITKVSGGDLSARVPEFKSITPRELTSLRCVLNALLDNWSDNRALLENSLEAAKDANRRKSEAISVLSHEMRTPLNGVVGALDLLKQTEMTALQRKYVGLVSNSTNTLLNHVNSVLEVSRLDNYKVKVEKDRVSIPELIKAIVKENSAQAEHTGSQIALSFAPDMPLEVETDAQLLRSIAANLIGNAVKFAPGGQIDVSAKADPKGFLEIVVKDNGPGIAERDIDVIFEPFAVVDATYGRKSEGTGLGLCIAAMSVDALDGQIMVNSEVGVGSEFGVRIPVEFVKVRSQLSDEQSCAPRAVQNALAHVTSSEPRHVLVVDDNETNRLVLSEMLKRLGHQVASAANGPDALEFSMVESFDLILMDISMPGMDGTDVAELLRQRKGPNQDTKIIAQTAHASPEDHDRVLAAGIQGVLTKPITMETLRSTLDGVEVDKGFLRADEAMAQLDLEQLKMLVSVKGTDFTIKSLDALLREVSSLIQSLKPSSPQDLCDQNVIDQVHATSGACATLGAKSLHRSLFQIEVNLKRGMMSSISEWLEAAERALEKTRLDTSEFCSRIETIK